MVEAHPALLEQIVDAPTDCEEALQEVGKLGHLLLFLLALELVNAQILYNDLGLWACLDIGRCRWLFLLLTEDLKCGCVLENRLQVFADENDTVREVVEDPLDG